MYNENTFEFFDTIGEAIDEGANPGDTLLVGAGEYPENVTVNKEGLTLKSVEGPEVTIIDADGQDRAIDIVADNVRIEGFTVKNFGQYAFNARSDGFEIVNNIVPEGAVPNAHAGTDSIYIWEVDGGLVKDNVMGPQFTVMSILDSKDIEITNNTFTRDTGWQPALRIDFSSDITVKGNTLEGFGWCIQLASFYGPLSDVFILDNEIKNNDRGVVVGYGIAGWDNHDITGVQVNNNNIVDNKDWGVQHNHGDDVDATANWWGDANGPGGEGPGDGDKVSENVIYDPWADSPF